MSPIERNIMTSAISPLTAKPGQRSLWSGDAVWRLPAPQAGHPIRGMGILSPGQGAVCQYFAPKGRGRARPAPTIRQQDQCSGALCGKPVGGQVTRLLLRYTSPANTGTATSSVFFAACPPLSTSFTLAGSPIFLISLSMSASTMITSASLPTSSVPRV